MKRIGFDNKYIISLVTILFSCSALSDSGKISGAQSNVEMLDAFCIQNHDSYKKIVPLVIEYGGYVLSKDEMDPAMRELGAIGTYVPFKDRNYFVYFKNGGGCTVVTQDVDISNTLKLLDNRFKLKLINMSVLSNKINEVYEVTKESEISGAIASIDYPLPNSNDKVGSLTFITSAITSDMRSD